ncbi:GNAT family N-acetyltransferase [Virgibacillus sp. 179-BFC.A HS]|uniref:GNAT family N-acetyltransferase n=1 Tax=Tigheibacillus jepli TaxID=3035914 RepID=A0ABU5CIK5_9BACI|nr:GNAT family N-acetyltransferase [Virgibacillus sp. 179-BFC.A HS]MDY0406155.1 GNAT family N-acetyltransferase [Virgibacillus sp. 179-BFC.A HS]
MKVIKVTTEAELKLTFQVRTEVFIEEQHVPQDRELDEYDQTATHFLGLENGEPIAAGRFRIIEDYGKLERICVKKAYRKKSYGKQIILAMEKELYAQHIYKAKLHAQTHAIGFYEKLGYKIVSGEFMDAGIPHVSMEKQLAADELASAQ